MKFKNVDNLPSHLSESGGLPRSRAERLLWIKLRIEDGYYESDRIRQAVADAFMDPPTIRRAGEQAVPNKS